MALSPRQTIWRDYDAQYINKFEQAIDEKLLNKLQGVNFHERDTVQILVETPFVPYARGRNRGVQTEKNKNIRAVILTYLRARYLDAGWMKFDMAYRDGHVWAVTLTARINS